ncbi:hypothetical protein OF122_13020 [Pelagibacterium flavum]|uniref:NusG-like N-terminal domain-containing protein n=1 Tax=Pelagibacterium flavum TaxID=2984530 RepID=A0ABY6INZ5_9HYPH|nr:transcription termination/antitermination NusG family protein [Pelagibacterium sp. YIM 151497]UYQ70980.1 hypothetical protein OF122_13020 [Pelagibacterium sp. YIM 151497]
MARHFDDDELHWYALDVVRQKELVAGYIFGKRGWQTFIPVNLAFQKKNKYAKSKIEVARPSLPGVVFVGFPSAPDWYHVMSLHLVNGVLSTDNRPRRIETATKEWLDYRSHQLDGQLVLEKQMVMHKGQEVPRTAALVNVQGRGVIRSPLSLKAKASKDRPRVITVAGERARQIGAILASGKGEEKQEAA